MHVETIQIKKNSHAQVGLVRCFNDQCENTRWNVVPDIFRSDGILITRFSVK